MIKISLLLIILAVIAGIGWLFRVRRHRPRTRTSRPEAVINTSSRQLDALRANKNYWGVEIQSCICTVAKTLAGKPFPFNEAPTLPLGDCPANCCTCVYVGLRERRVRHRRISPDRRHLIRYLHHNSDRRRHKERRKIDVWRTRRW
jgi:hypothetical protein